MAAATGKKLEPQKRSHVYYFKLDRLVCQAPFEKVPRSRVYCRLLSRAALYCFVRLSPGCIGEAGSGVIGKTRVDARRGLVAIQVESRFHREEVGLTD